MADITELLRNIRTKSMGKMFGKPFMMRFSSAIWMEKSVLLIWLQETRSATS